MRKLVILSISLISFFANADEIYSWCVTADAPTTSFFTEVTADQILLNIIHHNGVSYAPFWNNIIVPNDLSILSGKADLVKKLGDQIKVVWPSKSCKWLGEKKFSCVGGAAPIYLGEKTIQPWAYYSTVIKESSFAGDYEWVEMTLSYYTTDSVKNRTDSESGNIVMRYYTNDCEVSSKPISKLNRSVSYF
jgi:hypothetical protein